MEKINAYILLFFICLCFFDTNGQQPIPNTTKADTLETDTLKHIKIGEVEVTGQRKLEIGSVKLGQVQLAKEMTSDVRDLIRYTPGVGISYSSSRGGTRGFAIRGVEANRVAISVDGVQQPEIHENLVFSAYGLSNASRIEFDPYFVSEIDIQKGAASFSVGSGALGGAVNYTTKRARDLVGPGREIGATVQTNYNGKDNLRMYLLGAGVRKGKWEGLLMFADRYGDQIHNFEYGELNRNVTSTRVDPMDYKQQTLLGKVGFMPNDAHRVEFFYYMLNKRVDSEIWSQEPLDIFTSSDKPYYYADDQSLSHSYTLGHTYIPQNHWLTKMVITANLQHSYLDARTWSEYYRPNFYGGGDYKLIYEGRRDKYRGQKIKDKMGKISLDFREVDTKFTGTHRFSLTATIADKYNDNRNVDVENPVASNDVDGYTVRMGRRYEFGEPMGKFINAYSFQRPINRLNYSASLTDNIRFTSRLNLTFGVRYDRFHTRDKDWGYSNDQYYIDHLMRNLQNVELNNAAISDTDEGFSYLAAANYRFWDYLHLGYKFSTGFRVPTTEEKYFQYFSSWPSFLVLSNRELKPETSGNHEIEIAGNSRYGTYMLNFYRSDYSDFIDVERGTIEVTSPLDNSIKDLSYVKNVNRHSADLHGFDARIHVQLEEITPYLKGFSADAAASYAKGNTSYGTSMLGVQPLTCFAGLEYLSANQKWNANLKANYFKAKNRDETRFIENTANREIQRSFPSLFLNDAYTFDLYGYYQLFSYILVRAGVYNLFNEKYWRWDDLRQLTNPALLPHIENFFREGSKTITRFSQPRRYFSVSLEFNL
jgi:hemoglobin/transferrin/lactoferrin receptor protein